MAVPYTFATATSSIPLSQLDSNFATTITLGNTAIQLGNTVTTLNNMTLANVSISSGNVTFGNVTATTANVTTANVTTLEVYSYISLTESASTPTVGSFIYRPSSNAIAFGTANTERMRINSDGNVGIQNTGPSSYSAVNADNLVVGPNSGSNGITVVSGTTGTGNLAFADGAGTGGATDYAGLVQYDHNADNMNFFTGATERMRLNSSGLIAPAEVYRTTASSYLRLSGGDGVGSGANVIAFGQSHATAPGRLSLSSVGTGDIISNTISGTHIYQITGSEQMRLTSTGLGIGTSSPAAKLHVNGTGSGLLLTGSGYTNNPSGLMLGLYNSTTAYIQQPASASLLFWRGDSSTLMTLDTSGNLGLGVTPSAWETSLSRALQLNGGSLWGYSTSQINVLQNAYYNASGNFVYTNTAAASAYRQISGAHSWLTASSGTAGNTITFSQAMTLDTSGNLGLGVTPSAWSAFKAFELGAVGNSVWSPGSNDIRLATNYVYNGGSKYVTTGRAAMYEQAAGIHYWYTAASGTAGNAITFSQAMTLNANGNLLVRGTAETLVSASRRGVEVDCASGQESTFALNVNGTLTAIVGLASASDYTVGAVTNIPMLFRTNNTERARITSGGELLVGTTTVGAGIKSKTYYASSTAGNFIDSWYSDSGSAENLRAAFRVDGGLANYSANDVNLSDRREKTNFAPAKSYIDVICAIPVQTFNFIGQTDDEKTLGVVAQDVQAVAPELVSESNWGTDDNPKMRLGIYQTDLQYALMKCIQEQQVMINELKAEVAALKAK